MILGIRHVGYQCKNQYAVNEFYANTLGFKLIWDKWEDPEYINDLWNVKGFNLSVGLRTKKYKAPDGSVIEILFPHPSMQHVNFNHLALITDDIDEEYRRLSELGWYFTGKPCLSPDGNSKVAICFAPSGSIELVEIKVDWNEL